MVIVGQWVMFNDAADADHDALVTAVHGTELRPNLDVVTVSDQGEIVRHTSIPHYDGRLVTKEEETSLRRRRGGTLRVVQEVRRRQPGAYWRD